MPIHDSVAFLCNSVKYDFQEIIFLLASLFAQLIILHQLVGIISEVAEHANFLDRKSYIHLLLALLDRKSTIHASEDLNIEILNLERKCRHQSL